MNGGGAKDFEFAVVGGGLLGTSIAWGLARTGKRVAVLDEGDTATRASRANFSLVWVQGKGLGLPEYAGWTVRSAKLWASLVDELERQTGVDIAHGQPGGFQLALSEAELESRANHLKRFHNQAGMVDYKTEILDHAGVKAMMPDIGPEVVGGSYCPLDGHVNSLRLHRALHKGLGMHGAKFLASHKVERIQHEQGMFRLATVNGDVRAERIVLAAGNFNMTLAPMVGLSAPMKPERGQVLVTERVAPFLKHPIVTLRQTDEGTIMIGDSREEGTDDRDLTLSVNTVLADRAIRFFPKLARLNVVRTWTGIRVMTADGFPIYDQSATHPGAFVACCHSGVTLAAVHALSLAPMIAAGALDENQVGAFSGRRFNVSKAN